MRKPAIAVALSLMISVTAAAQDATPAQPAVPAVGEMAPDFATAGATRYGLLADRPMLSQLRGQTVVLAFFARARTRG